MANEVKPISPEEITQAKKDFFPDAVLQSFNELIIENYRNNSASFKQDEVVELMIKKGLAREHIFGKGWLNVKEVYEDQGWKVEHDKPAYNESYPTTFTFRKNK